MGTYTTITITGPNEDLARVKLNKLPDFEGWDGDDWTLVTTTPRMVVEQRQGVAVISKLHYENDPLDEHLITHCFNSKWGAQTAGEWAHRFTRKRPTLTVRVREEWDNRDADEPGMADDVFRAGEWVPAESRVNGEIPSNLSNLLEMARFALTVNDPAPAREALAALIEGLE